MTLHTRTRRLNCSNLTQEAWKHRAQALGLSLKSEDPAERGRSASKEVKRHYKDNPIRLWKMFLTKSETQWSVTRVLWLVKVFPWKHRSSPPCISFFLFLLCATFLTTYITQTHREVLLPPITLWPLHTVISHLWQHHSTFHGFQSLSCHRFSFKTILKQHI